MTKDERIAGVGWYTAGSGMGMLAVGLCESMYGWAAVGAAVYLASFLTLFVEFRTTHRARASTPTQGEG